MAQRRLPVVSLLLPRSRAVRDAGGEALRPGESPLSRNAVAGATIEVPIEATCSPTKVCARDCYAASGPQAVPHNLARQYRVLRSMRADPIAFAELTAKELERGRHGHLRWNGVGDLTEEAVVAINHLARIRPQTPIWVVTKIPELAAKIEHADNVFVHFSLDASGVERRSAFLGLRPKSRNYFFSYQFASDEPPRRGADLGASVLFYRRYKATQAGADLADPALCPLNTLADCAGACGACRRCFNGDAVTMRGAAWARESTPPPLNPPSSDG